MRNIVATASRCNASGRDALSCTFLGMRASGGHIPCRSGRPAGGGRSTGRAQRTHADGKRSAGRKGGSVRRVLRRSDGARARELPDLRNPHQSLSRVRRGVGHRQAGGGARQHRRRRDEQGDARGDRKGRRRPDEREIPRSVQGGLVPGRRGHLDQHERQRSDGQHRARADRAQEGRIQDRRAARPPEHVAVDQRLVSDRDQGGAPAAERQAHRGAREPGGVVPEERRCLHQHRQDGAHGAAGRGADDRRTGVPRVGGVARERNRVSS